jgi:hypothetical protein
MKQPAASASRAIRIVSASVLILNAGLYVAALFEPAALYAAIGISLLVLISYFFWTPVEYELASGELKVSFRIGCKQYSPVTRCSPVETTDTRILISPQDASSWLQAPGR